MESKESITLNAVLGTVRGGVVVIDAVGKIQSVNNSIEKLFGYSENELLGENVKILMPDPYHSEHDGYLESFHSTGEKKIIGTGRIVKAKKKDGSVFPIDLSVNEMIIDSEKFFVGNIMDITTEKLQESELKYEASRFQALMETVVDGLIVIDHNGLIQDFNPAAERIFGYKAEEVKGNNVKMLMPDPYHSEHDDYIKNFHDTGRKKIIGIGREVKAKRKDGTIFPMELGVGVMSNGENKMFVGTIRDISEKKQYIKDLQNYIDKLKISNKELDEFAYIASHDLKEPLRGVANNGLFLQEDYADILDEQGNKRIDRIRFLCHRMEKLLDELLYFSRLGRSELAITTFSMEEIVIDIESMLSDYLQEQNAKIVVQTNIPKITGDKLRLKEAVQNLITNAIKYNDNDEKIVEIGVSADAKSKDDSRTVFYVRDNGIGIDQKFYKDIFRIFKRINLEDDSKKGTGVGLTFVKKIIDRHNGKIWLDSALRQGTTFYFTIPERSDFNSEV